MGQGRRSGRFGAYLLACFDADSNKWQPVCKLGSGFSDEDLVRRSGGLPPQTAVGWPRAAKDLPPTATHTVGPPSAQASWHATFEAEGWQAADPKRPVG